MLMHAKMSLIEEIEQCARANDTNLPVCQKIAGNLQHIFRSRTPRMEEIERLVCYDPVLIGAVLAAANSPYYGGLSGVTTIQGAVHRLGQQQVIEIVKQTIEQSRYQFQAPELRSSMTKLRRAGMAAAIGARWLTQKLELQEQGQEIFLEAILHDIGQIHLIRYFDEVMASRKENFVYSERMLRDLLHSFHTEKGEEVLQSWHLPEQFCRAAKDHHCERLPNAQADLLILRLVDLACLKLGLGLDRDPSINLASTDEAAALGVREITLAELEIKIEDTLQLFA